MSGFVSRLFGLLLVVIASSVLCLAGFRLLRGEVDLTSIGLAHGIALLVGAVALCLVQGRDVSPEVILTLTGVRAGGTVLLGGLLLGWLARFRSEDFVLSVAVGYLAVLIYETWLMSLRLKRQQANKSGQATSRSPVEDDSPPAG